MLEFGGTRGRNSLAALAIGLVLMAMTWFFADGPSLSAMLIAAVGFFGTVWVYGEGPPETAE
ncbi:MAG: hypothetical protein KC912_03290 [Proteobacteria bacterium]|nr:hypothetical protein [Pseudomonadota bacterium]